jgi:putative ABC transport system permease protein
LGEHKARTALVVLSIAVGVFAVGMIATSRVILAREMNRAWQAVTPASASLYPDHFDEEVVWTVRHMPEVREADARRTTTVRFRKGPADRRMSGLQEEVDDSPTGPAVAWRNLWLYSYLDYDDIRVFKLRPLTGAYPPPEHEVLIERASLAWIGLEEGDTFEVESAAGIKRTLRIAGTVHDQTQMVASWLGQGTGYVTPETMQWLGLADGFDELMVVAAGDTQDKAHIGAVAQAVRNKVERGGHTVYWTWIPTPGEHPAQQTIDPMMLVLGMLGVLSLIAGGFLVFNTLQALLAQQTRQIGVMKALGAKNGQIVGLYYTMVLIYSLLALLFAVPLGALAAYGFTRYTAGVVNFDIASFGVPPQVLTLEVIVGLVVPLLAALYPVLGGVRITAREAMSDYGMRGGQYGQGRVDRLLERVQSLPRPLLLSLRNTFRRKGRLVLTLSTLTISGAIFIAVLSTQASMMRSIDETYEYIDYDIVLSMERGYRIDQLEREALVVPGVAIAEAWRFDGARRVRPDGTESQPVNIRAPRTDTALISPTITEGRWLLPDDENAIVVNTYFLKDEPDIGVGDEMTLKLGRDETAWRVVGIAGKTPPTPMAFVNQPYYAELTGAVGRAGTVIVATEQHDPASQTRIAEGLEKHFEAAGLRVASTLTSSSERAQIASQLNILVIFLMIMAILLALVGAVGLTGTMSLNVLERTREVGVMRAIGAGGFDILRIVVVEGVLIGLLSWGAGALLAYPLGKVLSDAVGVSTLQMKLTYAFSVTGVGIWLVAVVVLSALASFWPARSASKVTVREVLAYE